MKKIGSIGNFLDLSLLEQRDEKQVNISRKELINTLNYLNFQDSAVIVNLRNRKYNNFVSLKALPLPCQDEILRCKWVDQVSRERLASYDFHYFLIDVGQNLILVKPELKEIDENGIYFDLSHANTFEVCFRKMRRYPCLDIKANFIQNGIIFHGSLVDFSATSCNVEIYDNPPLSFKCINTECTVTLILKNDKQTLYSGECRIVRKSPSQGKHNFVLEPLKESINRYKKKEFRSRRHDKLFPAPNIRFTHPFTNQFIQLKILELSGSGFSVQEHQNQAVLLPGMIIPELEIKFASGARVKCMAQVVYKNFKEEEAEDLSIKYGMAIIDMDVQEQLSLAKFLHQATDEKSYVSSRVNMDELWKFFFETGFVYPRKYVQIHSYKEHFKKTYEKLYIKNPTIARHFTYLEKGAIQSHIAMLRVFESTWLFHHHTSDITRSTKGGLIVLDQIARYVNDFYHLNSTHMDYVICYFRPENRFPSRVFGGIRKYLGKPKACSTDVFSHLIFQNVHRVSPPVDLNCEAWKLSDKFALAQALPEDLAELYYFYDNASGGLAIHALDLMPQTIGNTSLSEEYTRIGFSRNRMIFSLKKGSNLIAVILLNITDFGMNMSNLTNCMHVFILEPDVLSRAVFNEAILTLAQLYSEDEIPVLVYPNSYTEKQAIPTNKEYTLWSFDTSNTDYFIKYTSNLFSRAYRRKV
ncbi:MAG: PilZ domain-containing protein [Planctomycetota bacterium]|jgi:hypothetical protein